MKSTESTRTASRSRAVVREIPPGTEARCVACGLQVKFAARKRLTQVICNIYVGRRWDRVEHFHQACYVEAGEPYGPADSAQPLHYRRPGS